MRINRGLVSRLLAIALLPVQSGMCQEQAILHEGQPVRIRISRTLSSQDAKTGETVDFETLDDVKAGSATAIPKGSIVLATVTEALPKRPDFPVREHPEQSNERTATSQ